jgi:UDP-4-amino-4,6-dideoxy-N-acetyl-beta-L-altrosamine transaminase
MIPYGRQSISLADKKAVLKVLGSNYLTQGPEVEIFEKKYSSFVGSKYAIAANSATSGLHVACLALGLSKKSLVWTSPNSFVASANCALYCGAMIDFVDIEKNTLNICIDSLKKKLDSAKKNNTLPDLVIPVHFSGLSCNMKALSKLSKSYGFKILEDASHAVGASYDSLKVGSCKYSDAAIFSFHPVKIITTGEGGMVTTNNKKLASKIKNLISHGIVRNKDEIYDQSKINSDWYYEQHFLGFNFRMTEIAATLGSSQLARVEKFLSKRRKIAFFYEKNLNNPNLEKPNPEFFSSSSLHLYIIKCINNDFRERLFKFLRKKGYFVQLHYFPIHLQPFYKELGFQKGMFPVSEDYSERAISLPIFYDLKIKDLKIFINLVNSFK